MDFVNAEPVVSDLLFFGFGVCSSLSELFDTTEICSIGSLKTGADIKSELFDSSCLFSSSVGEFLMGCCAMSFFVCVFPAISALTAPLFGNFSLGHHCVIMHYLFKAIMIHMGLVLGLGNMQ